MAEGKEYPQWKPGAEFKPDASRLRAPSPDAAWSAAELEAEMESVSAEEWMPDCIVALTEPRPEDEPLLELVRIGT